MDFTLSDKEFCEKIFKLSVEDLVAEFEKFFEQIIPTDPNDHSIESILNQGRTLFLGNSKEEFDERHRVILYQVAVFNHAFNQKDLLMDDNDTKIKLTRLFEILYYWKLSQNSLYIIQRRFNDLYNNELNIDIGTLRFKMFEPEDKKNKPKPIIPLIQYLLHGLLEHGYRRQDNMCMRRIYTSNNYDSHAWKPLKSIESYIYEMTQSTNNPIMHEYYLRSSSKEVLKYLENCQEVIYFPVVVKDRSLFSFENGLYETNVWNADLSLYEDRWYSHESGRSKLVHVNRSACNFFELDFPYDEYCDVPWYDIPTSSFQSILEYQRFPIEVCKWMYILCGRLLHELKSLDNWQIMPFLKGKAGTGKSTILGDVCKHFFDFIDVGFIGNKPEETFGLQGFYNKLLFIATEVKGNFGLEQATFQQIISGEEVSVARKFGTPDMKRWTVPGIISGNQPPNYQDNQGSIGRRLAIFEFAQKVNKNDIDPELSDKLKKELPSILFKCNRAYIEAVNKYRKNDIWKILPKYFQETRDQMADQINSLVNFLGSDQLIYNPEFYCKKKRFTQKFTDHCMTNNLKRSAFRKDYFEGPFEDRNIKVVRCKKFDRDDGRMVTAEWIIGVEIRDDYEDDSKLQDDIDLDA
jgi:hypothetical protein